MTIKKVSQFDVPCIVQIHKKCISTSNALAYSPEIINSWISRISENCVTTQLNISTWIVILESDLIVGFAQYSITEQTLYQIQIDPEYQGKGYGKTLYKYIEQEFINAKSQRISLNSTLNAVQYYKSLNFVQTGKLNYEGIEMIKMEKHLLNPTPYLVLPAY
jgi:GNAT superfamily N-acetyltransferase